MLNLVDEPSVSGSLSTSYAKWRNYVVRGASDDTASGMFAGAMLGGRAG